MFLSFQQQQNSTYRTYISLHSFSKEKLEECVFIVFILFCIYSKSDKVIDSDYANILILRPKPNTHEKDYQKP